MRDLFGGTVEDENFAMGAAFAQWQQLTDAYAAEVRALQRGDPAAAAKLVRIASELHRSREFASAQRSVLPLRASAVPAAPKAQDTVRQTQTQAFAGWPWTMVTETLARWRSPRRQPEARPT